MALSVAEEVAELKRRLSDLEWVTPLNNGEAYIKLEHLSAMLRRRIDYLTKEYVKRGIVFEPDF